MTSASSMKSDMWEAEVLTPKNLLSSFETPPSTPRVSRNRRSLTPPPAPRRQKDPPLMQAIYACDERLLQGALELDPDAAKVPFLDHACEPPLCLACRVLCSEALVQILLEHGADVSAVDVHGRTPLAILSASSVCTTKQSWAPIGFMDFPPLLPDMEKRSIEIAKLLLKAGANPFSADGAGTKGCTCIQLARDCANTHLFVLYQDFMQAEDDQPTSNN